MIQYTLPILIISVLHVKIGQRLRTRHNAMEVLVIQDAEKRIKEAKVIEKTWGRLIQFPVSIFTLLKLLSKSIRAQGLIEEGIFNS